MKLIFQNTRKHPKLLNSNYFKLVCALINAINFLLSARICMRYIYKIYYIYKYIIVAIQSCELQLKLIPFSLIYFNENKRLKTISAS